MTRKIPPAIPHGIDSARRGDYLMGLTVLADFYEHHDGASDFPEGISWYGLCLANVSRNFDQAIRMCEEAIEKEPERAVHYFNTAAVQLLKGNRKAAIETMERGLVVDPGDPELNALRERMGIRSKPTVPFLHRAHAVNRAIGHVIHAAKRKRPAKKKK